MGNSTLRGLGTYCSGHSSAIKFFAKALVSSLFLIFILQFNGNAQVAFPACNISGPLETVAQGSDISIQVQIAHSTSTPKLSYEFKSNSANAFIRTKAPIVYNAATNTATQVLTVSPGTTGTEFNLKLEVSTPGGLSSCSKSVSVAPSANGGSSSTPGGSSTPPSSH